MRFFIFVNIQLIVSLCTLIPILLNFLSLEYDSQALQSYSFTKKV
jgi:hypothetical protein